MIYVTLITFSCMLKHTDKSTEHKYILPVRSTLTIDVYHKTYNNNYSLTIS